MNLAAYRVSPAEKQRAGDLLGLVPETGKYALDVGARDGHFSLLLADRFERVVALDLDEPEMRHHKIDCVRGNALDLPFDDGSFDLVFCAEVLEHIPGRDLQQVCREIERVSSRWIVIGVPYKQDIRVGRTTCRHCGGTNPPWGHLNSFDEERLSGLFNRCQVEKASFVGKNNESTNAVSAKLMDFAGNPYGTYGQEEACMHCGHRLLAPADRNAAQLISTKLAFWARTASEAFSKPRANWIHMLLRKKTTTRA